MTTAPRSFRLRPCVFATPSGQPIAAALGAIIAFDGVTRLGPAATPTIVLPIGVGVMRRL